MASFTFRPNRRRPPALDIHSQNVQWFCAFPRTEQKLFTVGHPRNPLDFVTVITQPVFVGAIDSYKVDVVHAVADGTQESDGLAVRGNCRLQITIRSGGASGEAPHSMGRNIHGSQAIDLDWPPSPPR